MNPAVLAGYMTSEGLQAVFKELACPGGVLLLEGLTAVHMQRVPPSEDLETLSVALTTYEIGWLFDGTFEFHWQWVRGYPAHVPPFRARIICDDTALLMSLDPGAWHASSGQRATVMPLTSVGGEAFVLWGEAVRDTKGRATGDWYEKEVPHFLRYPVNCDDKARRLQLLIKNYTLLHAWHSDDEKEAIRLHRFSAIVPVQES